MIQQEKQSHLLTDEQQAIVALCTPRGSGAIGLIRISGDNAIDVVDRIARLSSRKKLAGLPSHTIHHGYVVDNTLESFQTPSGLLRTSDAAGTAFALKGFVSLSGDEKKCLKPACPEEPGEAFKAKTGVSKDSSAIVDSVLFLLMHGPRTFTGQHTVEITCHNNPFIIEKIIDLAVKAGARRARGGEFTRRAFLNNKVDLVQAESINDVIHAQSEQALEKSLSQLEGSLSQVFASVYSRIVDLLAHVEASFEFLDEEQRDFEFDKDFNEQLCELLVEIQEIKKDFSLQQQIKQGVRIALLGCVNAGKSTLFNALLKKERAIVSDIQGTTRDSIESTLYRDGSFWMMIDTAGIRQTGDVIEQKGIERSFYEADQADIILLVVDGSKQLTSKQQEQYHSLASKHASKTLVVLNKADVLHEENEAQSRLLADFSPIVVSAKNKEGIQILEKRIEEKKNDLFDQLKTPFLLNKRHHAMLTEIEQSLKTIANKNSNHIEYELVAYLLKDLLEKVSQLTGRNVTEELLDTVFDQFCVGK